ncbi:MAG: AmmeMemoRadiSam system protein A [Candidatus Marinimicrobia bacterium]|nr:AmmeMemoRadiSam system protein A [Candidatus Neomarinimicrobiota bacterium]MCF7850242.1 AmmeMemoRadiSam system protein A [Candidatus Neomarinimicrobiota bacterium]MCF7903716.1 AmmeMemoRadiSam system protein A [Candidatus Neomarinimicrobiota bacterium]
MSDPLYSLVEQKTLLQVARESIQHGLRHGRSLAVDPDNYAPALARPGAAFVTLEKMGNLRGCIGSILAHRPLVEDVAENAWSAAFKDPRFDPLDQPEFDQLHIEISVLTKPEEMQVESDADLKQQLVPGKDGLIIQDGHHRALFLPAVWDKLPEVDDFVSHLKQKAGLTREHWSASLRCERFYSFEFSEIDVDL